MDSRAFLDGKEVARGWCCVVVGTNTNLPNPMKNRDAIDVHPGGDQPPNRRR